MALLAYKPFFVYRAALVEVLLTDSRRVVSSGYKRGVNYALIVCVL
jgi:hypothetical protein